MTRNPLLLAALISVSVGSLSAVAQTVPAYVAAAVSDKGRPAADKQKSPFTSAIRRALGSAAPTRTPIDCYDSTFLRARICRCTVKLG